MEYRFERLSRQNIHHLGLLHWSVYGKKVSGDYYLKKYQGPLESHSFIGFIAFNEELPHAFFGIIPCSVLINNKTVIAGQSTDAMTIPAYRKLGLFEQLVKLAYAQAIELKIRFLFGFPNQNSHLPLIEKLGQVQVAQMQSFELVITTIPLLRIINRIKGIIDITAFYKQLFFREKNRSSKEAIAGFELNSILIHNRDYFLYKHLGNNFIWKIKHSFLWCKITNQLLAGNLFLAATDDIREVIAELKQKCFWRGISSIHFQCTTNTLLYSQLIEYFPSQPGFPVLVLQFGEEINTGELKFTLSDIDIF